MNITDQNGKNGGITAQPKGDGRSEVETAFDTDSASVTSARKAGYINGEGEAVEMAKSDVEGSPTGAYTDIGSGRSSVVKSHKTIEKGPEPGEEVAP